MVEHQKTEPELPLWRNVKLGAFHIGSSMSDVLGSGVWNRIMLQELGYAATPIGFLLALRYFMSPLAAWAGERSDYTDVRGYRRLPWVWGGRLGMVLGYMLIAFSTVELVRHGQGWWLGIVAGFLLASIGQAVSGSTFLALVYERAPQAQRGRAVGVVWTFLLAGYAVAGVLFARLLPTYDEGAFLAFFGGVGLLLGLLWFFSTLGEERPLPKIERPPISARPPLREELRGLLSQAPARALAGFMLVSFMAAFMQDALLEPFGGKVFGMSVGETTRFQAYWGTMAILSSFGALWAFRHRVSATYQRLSRWGVWLLILTFGVLALTALTEREALLRPALLLLGVGYGLWNIGTVGLMVVYSRESNAGLDLGVWTVVATLCRGGGVFAGALLYDFLRASTGEVATAFGLVFALEAALLVLSLPLLANIQDEARPAPCPAEKSEGELVLGASLD